MGSVAQLTLSLAAIVALIFAVSWIVKRLKLGTPRSRGDIAVIDELALGPRERIMLVRVGDVQVLVASARAGGRLDAARQADRRQGIARRARIRRPAA